MYEIRAFKLLWRHSGFFYSIDPFLTISRAHTIHKLNLLCVCVFYVQFTKFNLFSMLLNHYNSIYFCSISMSKRCDHIQSERDKLAIEKKHIAMVTQLASTLYVTFSTKYLSDNLKISSNSSSPFKKMILLGSRISSKCCL